MQFTVPGLGNAEKLLQAFPPVFPDESVDVRALRQAAYHQCWSALSQHLEVGFAMTHATVVQCPTSMMKCLTKGVDIAG